MMRLSTIALAMLVFSSANLLVAQAAKPKRSDTPVKLHALPVETPFDPAHTRLPLGFRGNNTRVILDRLLTQAKLFEKSEFETKADYEARVSEGNAKPFVGRVTRTDLLSFVCDDCVKSTYDADRGCLRIDLDIIPSRFIDLPHSSKHYSSYIASNAFGGTVRVDREDTVASTLHMQGIDWFNRQKQDIPMSVEKARSAKARLKAVLLYHLSPYRPATVSDSYSKATFDIPSEGRTTDKDLFVTLESVWVVDSSTGDVLTKTTPDNAARTEEAKRNEEHDTLNRKMWESLCAEKPHQGGCEDRFRDICYRTPQYPGCRNNVPQ
jgi:hypothetical protein